jgi:hypothetical protein
MRIACCLFVVVAALVAAAPAAAAPVVVLDADGRAREVDDPFLPASAGGRAVLRAPVREPAAAASRGPKRTVPGELRRLLQAGALTPEEHDARREAYDSARALAKRLPGLRAVEMRGTLKVIEGIAARGSLTASRVRPLWETLAANRRWWTTGPLLAPGKRVRLKPAELIWQYVPGQGLQFHPLANFGRLNGLWAGKDFDDRLSTLVDELVPMAAQRGGGVAWEYYFAFAHGKPPWVSGMAQATALQSLARAGIRLNRKGEVFDLTGRALTVFELPPPTGVRLAEGEGAHYLLYSFDRGLRVLNGFMQTLVGLHDYAGYANNPEVRALFEAGDREARREVPRFDTGAWSLYSRGRVTHESDLGYHKVLRGFLASLCSRTAEDVYCSAAERFGDYLLERPRVEIVSRRLRGGTVAAVRFKLSKISNVGARIALGDRLVYQRAASRTGYGERAVLWRVPRRPGRYRVAITAVDLAGNVGSTAADVEVLKPKRRK